MVASVSPASRGKNRSADTERCTINGERLLYFMRARSWEGLMAANIIPYTEIPVTMICADFLSANEFRICAILHSLSYKKRVTPSQAELAKKSNIALRTVQNSIDSLVEKGIIVSVEREGKYGHFTENEYKFVAGGWNAWHALKYGAVKSEKATVEAVSEDALRAVDGISVSENPLSFVRIYNDFLYSNRLTSQQLRVFLYLKKFSHCKSIFPRYADMQSKMGISKPTAIKTIKELGDIELVTKLIQMSATKGGYTSNEYLILNEEELKDWLYQSKFQDVAAADDE